MKRGSFVLYQPYNLICYEQEFVFLSDDGFRVSQDTNTHMYTFILINI